MTSTHHSLPSSIASILPHASLSLSPSPRTPSQPLSLSLPSQSLSSQQLQSQSSLHLHSWQDGTSLGGHAHLVNPAPESFALDDPAKVLQLARARYAEENYAAAESLLNAILARSPDSLPAMLLLGCCYYASRRYSLAIRCNAHILALNPFFAEAYSNLGTTYRALNVNNLAELCYRHALALKPLYWDAISNLAGLLAISNRYAEALELYENTLNLVRNVHALLDHHFDIHAAIGNLRFILGDVAGARQAFLSALHCVDVEIGYRYFCTASLFPSSANLQHYAVTSETALQPPALPDGSVPASIALLHHLDAVVGILATLAKMYQDNGMPQMAIACYYTSLSIAPSSNTCNNLGILLSSLNLPEKTDEAIQWYSFGLSLDSSHVHLFTNIGSALKERGRIHEAIACYQKAVTLQPNFFIALANLGNALKDLGKIDEAIGYYEKALALKPDFVDAYCNYVHSLNFICDWRDRNKHFERIRAMLDELASNQVPSVLPFHTFTYPLTIQHIREISIRNANRIKAATMASGWWSIPHPIPPTTTRLKIGYVSSDFGNHPLSHLMQSVFGFHDRFKFEVFCYALSQSDNSSYRHRIENTVEHFVDVSTMPSQEIVERIVADGIHCLVNLNGYTKGARNEIFAARPCPVQISYMGFAGTMGADWIDYLAIDEVVAPPAIQDLGLYTEKLILLPHCYFVTDHRQGFREGIVEASYADGHLRVLSDEEIMARRRELRNTLFPYLPENTIIMCNFNQLYKLDPKIFQLWLRILNQTTNTVLWLLRFPPLGETNIRNYINLYAPRYCPNLALDEVHARIIFTDVAGKEDHILRGLAADIFLDTPECNAHTTAADILWAGTPMLTLPKIKLASRVAASICFASGFGEWMVVTSYEAYEERMILWAQQPDRLFALRKELMRARQQSRLFDTPRWVVNLERGIQQAWNQFQSGQAPETIRVEDPDDADAIVRGDIGPYVSGKDRIEMSMPPDLNTLVADMTAPIEE